MALFLVTCVFDQGLTASSFKVVKASSQADVARDMLKDYASWENFVENSIFYGWLYDDEEGPVEQWNNMGRVISSREDGDKLRNHFRSWFMNLSPEEILKWIRRTKVDGDSSAQLAIHEIGAIKESR